MSSFLFQLAISHALEHLRTFCTTLSYVDDNYLPNQDLSVLNRAHEELTTFESRFGLVLNSKTVLFSNIPITESDFHTYPFLCRVQVSTDGLEVLGSAIGSSIYVQNHVDAHISSIHSAFDTFTNVVAYSKSPLWISHSTLRRLEIGKQAFW